MKNQRPLLTLMAMIGMCIGMFVSVSVLGFGVTDDLDPPSVRLYLQPAGYAFLIWLFIYLGMLGFGIFQFLPQQKKNPRLINIRIPMIINAIANVLWFMGVLTNQLWLTVLCMGLMLVTLTQASVYAEIGRTKVKVMEVCWVRIPISLYFGWITVAIPINITAFFLDLGIDGLGFPGPEIWSVLMLSIAAGIVSLVYLYRYANSIYPGVLLWALVAIGVANYTESVLVFWAVVVLAIGVSGLLLVTLTHHRAQYRIL